MADTIKQREYAKRYRERHPEKARLQSRNSQAKRRAAGVLDVRYGYPKPTRPRPLLCECCGAPPVKKVLCLDHDHATNAFRGWLCDKCNVGVGLLGDSLAGVQRMAAYLQRSVWNG